MCRHGEGGGCGACVVTVRGRAGCMCRHGEGGGRGACVVTVRGEGVVHVSSR